MPPSGSTAWLLLHLVVPTVLLHQPLPPDPMEPFRPAQLLRLLALCGVFFPSVHTLVPVLRSLGLRPPSHTRHFLTFQASQRLVLSSHLSPVCLLSVLEPLSSLMLQASLWPNRTVSEDHSGLNIDGTNPIA